MITTRTRVQLSAKTMNGPEGEFTRIYLHCECGKELASFPLKNLTDPWLTEAQCVDCRSPSG